MIGVTLTASRAARFWDMSPHSCMALTVPGGSSAPWAGTSWGSWNVASMLRTPADFEGTPQPNSHRRRASLSTGHTIGPSRGTRRW